MPKSSFYKWYKRFADESEGCGADEPHVGRPVSMRNATSIEKVKLAFRNDCRQSIRDIADNIEI